MDTQATDFMHGLGSLAGQLDATCINVSDNDIVRRCLSCYRSLHGEMQYDPLAQYCGDACLVAEMNHTMKDNGFPITI